MSTQTTDPFELTDAENEALSCLWAIVGSLYWEITPDALRTLSDQETDLIVAQCLLAFEREHPGSLNSLAEAHPWEALAIAGETASHWSLVRRDLLGIEVIVGNPFITADGDEITDYALHNRRIDAVLEALQTTFAVSEALAALNSLTSDLIEAGKSKTKKALTSTWLAEGVSAVHETQVWFTGIYVPGLDSAIRWGQTKLDTVSNEDLASGLAEDLMRAYTCAGHEDLGPVRNFGSQLSDAVREMSTSSADVSRTAMITSVLDSVAAMLGDDEGLLVDDAPDFVGMRLSDARHRADAHEIPLEVADGLTDADGNGRWIMNEGNWIVDAQTPSANQPLGKRRRVRLVVFKRDEVAFPRSR